MLDLAPLTVEGFSVHSLFRLFLTVITPHMKALGYCPKSPRHCFGDAIVRAWLDEIERRAGDDNLAWALGLTCKQFRNVVAALAMAVRRLQTAEGVEACIRETFPCAQTAVEVVHRVDMGSAVIIKRLVNDLGADYDTPEAMDVLREPTMPELAPGELQHLPWDLQAMANERGRWPASWLSALRRATHENAAWGHGRCIDIAHDQGLGQLLDRLRG